MVNVEVEKTGAGRGISVSSKSYILIAVATLLGLGSGYLFSAGELLYGTLLLASFLAFFVIETFLISARHYLATAVVLNAIAFASPFLKLFSMYFLVGFAIFVLFLLHGAYRGRYEMENMVKVHFMRLVRVVFRPMAAAMVVFLSIVVLLSSNFSVSREGADRAIKFATPIVGRFVEGFDGNANTGELLIDIIKKELSTNENFINLSLRDRNAVVNANVAELKLGIEERIGAAIRLDKSVSENMYEIINTRLLTLTPRAQIFWSAILIAVLWISLQSVEFLVYIPLAILVFLIYELLFVLKFATMQMEMRSKEVISLK